MFYWKNKTANNKTLTEEMMSCGKIHSVQIATAYLSKAGVSVLKQIADTYKLKQDKIMLYLSSEFSPDNPGELLEDVCALCTVKIFLESTFHSKVYLFRGNENKLIYGSSNFTKGGLTDNVEFDYIGAPNSDELSQVTIFFEYCDNRASAVTDELIDFYKGIQKDAAKLSRVQRSLSSLLSGFIRKDDAFTPDDYDITNYYFQFEDYETFFSRNAKKVDSTIKRNRESVQAKMLSIHDVVFPKIKRLGIEHHKREENITSLTYPDKYNKYTVDWMCIRYGKTPFEVDSLNIDARKEDDIYGFQRHGCLQFSISSSEFKISLFFAVRHDAVDRMWLHQHLDEKRLNIETEMSKLKGHGLVWTIWCEDIPIEFFLDTQPIESFCDWFDKNDMDGRESLLSKHYSPDDEVMQTRESISTEINRIMTMLLPLYNTVVWRIKK